MAAAKFYAYFFIFVACISIVASDPDPLQDLCVANKAAGTKVNGYPCKDEANVTADDFFFNGLANPGPFQSLYGVAIIGADVDQIPGLNTLGISLARADVQPGGLIPPHTHPRASEFIFVLDGVLDVGFITTSNKFISKTVKKGDVFAFPRGLIHFQKNNGDKPASVLAGFNSQLPGVQIPVHSLFNSTPAVPDNILTKAFQIGTEEVEKIKTKLAQN